MTQTSRRPHDHRSRGAAIWLMVAAITVVGCGSGPSPTDATTSSFPQASSPGRATALPSAAATKVLMPIESVTFVGWTDGSPAVAVREGTGKPPDWAIRTISPIGWVAFGALPAGSAPVTDGRTVANVPDPETGPDVALLLAGSAIKDVTLPNAAWADRWRGIAGLTPLVGKPGYLLVGAGAIAIVDDSGAVSAAPTPEGFVALAPTSDPKRFLLATIDDADEAGGLSESAPFAAYLWTIGSQEMPLIVRRHVVAVVASSVGLAWLRTDDGSWWSLTNAGAVDKASLAARQRSVISPDGRHLVRFSDSVTGCAMDTSDPCPVSLIDDVGSIRVFDGPSSGVGFDGEDIGMVLYARVARHLTWRLVFGPADDPSTATIQ